MNFLQFKSRMFGLACFSIDQVYAWQPDFDRNNLYRWTKQGMLIRLRQGYFTFPDYNEKPDYALYFANRIYRPSYISLHTALSFYGIIPEAVVQITSVSPLKTAAFNNSFAQYTYKTIKKELMFGYVVKPFNDGRVILMASPEKALLDLLYLYPEYNSHEQLEYLRFDESFLQEDFDKQLVEAYALRFQNKALVERVKILKSTYNL